MAVARALFFLPLLLMFSSLIMAETNPVWRIDGSYKLRYETLDNAYRANTRGGDQILVSQLLASVKANGEYVFGELEIQDARSWLDDNGTPLGTDDVNTLEPLQAWLGWRQEAFVAKVGRLNFDIGSRRLMARQRFRNTINAFDGVYGSYQQEQWQWQAFYLKPVEPRPAEREDLDDNKIKLDKQGDDRFWGLHVSRSEVTDLELYYYGLDEDDNGAEISTVGFRNLKPATPLQWHYEVEAAYQFGETGNLDVSAAMLHAAVGYQFDDPLSSRIELMADYASGDDDPNDDESNQFNALFGVTRFDFGPTAIYGAFARANILSPGVKWDFKPSSNSAAYLAYRAIWLDSAKAAQARSGLRDTAGDSGRFAGNQLEVRWQWALSAQLQLELGGAYLLKGEFLEDAPNAPDTGDTSYVYSQISYQL